MKQILHRISLPFTDQFPETLLAENLLQSDFLTHETLPAMLSNFGESPRLLKPPLEDGTEDDETAAFSHSISSFLSEFLTIPSFTCCLLFTLNNRLNARRNSSKIPKKNYGKSRKRLRDSQAHKMLRSFPENILYYS
jgi:hypothetical protein